MLFVSQQRFNNLRAELQKARDEQFQLLIKLHAVTQKYDQLHRKWDNLVDEINAKGGRAFLDNKPTQLSQDEIRKLLSLCHPDKHDGKPVATEMTQLLLRLKK